MQFGKLTKRVKYTSLLSNELNLYLAGHLMQIKGGHVL